MSSGASTNPLPVKPGAYRLHDEAKADEKAKASCDDVGHQLLPPDMRLESDVVNAEHSIGQLLQRRRIISSDTRKADIAKPKSTTATPSIVTPMNSHGTPHQSNMVPLSHSFQCGTVIRKSGFAPQDFRLLIFIDTKWHRLQCKPAMALQASSSSDGRDSQSALVFSHGVERDDASATLSWRKSLGSIHPGHFGLH